MSSLKENEESLAEPETPPGTLSTTYRFEASALRIRCITTSRYVTAEYPRNLYILFTTILFPDSVSERQRGGGGRKGEENGDGEEKGGGERRESRKGKGRKKER